MYKYQQMTIQITINAELFMQNGLVDTRCWLQRIVQAILFKITDSKVQLK